jgi:2-polyprenyl-3-methyl-5-hydroxy-6-metoxy-1,4-benzoquinol methylase
MHGDKVHDPGAEVIAANVDFYRNVAKKYDQYESCVHDDVLQRMLWADLERMRGLLQVHSANVRCLDCGGGSGNISLKMLEMGWDVTVVDVSSDMLNLLDERARARGFSPTLVNSSIEAFLTSGTDQYDVITFNSVLHHLFSYLEVVDHVADHIRPGGLFYSNFDPVIPNGLLLPKLLESLDTILAKAFHDQSDFLPGIVRRVRKVFSDSDQVHQRAIASSGDLAEYHAKSGVDDQQIIALLQKRKFAILDHERWTGGRTWLARSVNNHLRLMETFKILARHPAESDQEHRP